MKDGLKRILGLAGFAGALASVPLLENIGTTEHACEIYRGYRTSSLGEIFYSFDSLSKEERDSSARYPLKGDPKLKDGLLNEGSMGDRFCFSYKSPTLPTGRPELISIQRENPKQEKVEDQE